MTTEEFVKAFYNDKQNFLELYLSENPETEVRELIKSPIWFSFATRTYLLLKTK